VTIKSHGSSKMGKGEERRRRRRRRRRGVLNG
jgi:hypothetical protein